MEKVGISPYSDQVHIAKFLSKNLLRKAGFEGEKGVFIVYVQGEGSTGWKERM